MEFLIFIISKSGTPCTAFRFLTIDQENIVISDEAMIVRI